MYGRLSFAVDNLITAGFFLGALTLLVLAAYRATDLPLLLSLASLASFVAWMRTPRRFRREGPAVIQFIRQSHVEVHEGKIVDRAALSALGGRRGFLLPWLWTFATPDDRSLARVLGALRDLGLRFDADPKGGSPAETFDALRERGLISGAYKTPADF